MTELETRKQDLRQHQIAANDCVSEFGYVLNAHKEDYQYHIREIKKLKDSIEYLENKNVLTKRG